MSRINWAPIESNEYVRGYVDGRHAYWGADTTGITIDTKPTAPDYDRGWCAGYDDAEGGKHR